MSTRQIRWKKLISLILILVMVFQLVPMQVLAEEAKSETIAENTGSDIQLSQSKDELSEKLIVGEITEKREENVKHFLNEDGSFTAVKYFKPVHYRVNESEKWCDIDNSLLLKSTKSDSDNAAVYAPVSSPLNVELAQHYSSEKPVVFKSQDYELSWSYERVAVGTNSDKVVGSINNSTTTEIQSNAANDIVAKKIEKSSSFEEKQGNEKFIDLDSLYDGIVYCDVYPNVDIEYIIDSVYFKENIVLKNNYAKTEYIVNYNVGDLVAEQIDDHTIALKDKEASTIYEIYAPYMVDSSNETSENVILSILSQDSGVVKVIIKADSTWLNDEKREYPVRIDPYILESVQNYNQDGTAIYKPQTSGSYPYGSLVVGNDRGAYYSKSKAYVEFTLPTLTAGDIVVEGILGLAQYSGTAGYSHVGTPSMQINAYRVTSNWTESSIRSSTYYNGLPSIDDTVIDYVNVSSRSSIGLVEFDVSKLVKQWYDGVANFGICLMANNENDYAVAKFIASNNPSFSGGEPRLVIRYLNSKGLENIWTTHSQSLGESGAAHINDYSGNLTFVAPIIATTGNKMPVSLSLVYNGSQGANSINLPSTVGLGWRLNIQNKILIISPTSNENDLNTKLYNAGYRFIYDDEDGTTHYFKEDADSNGVYKDEDGLGITIQQTSTDPSPNYEKYTMTFEDGTQLIFTSRGCLRKAIDTNGNYYEIKYAETSPGETWRISKIIDGAGREIVFTSNTEGRIETIKDPANRVVSFLYTAGGKLYQINYPDGTSTAFTYSAATNQMLSVHSRDGNWLKYSYQSSGDAASKNRVVKVEEYSRNDSGTFSSANRGNSISIDYQSMNRTVFTDNKGRSEAYTFDNCGRTINIFGADGNAIKYSYEDASTTNDKANTLTSVAATERFVDNLLINHSFENDLNSWSGTADISTSENYLGNKSVKINGSGHITQTVCVGADYYTLSAYVKGTSSNSKSNIEVKYYDNAGTQIRTDASPEFELANNWTRMHYTFNVPNNATTVRVEIKNCGTDDIWIDCAQLEKGKTVNAYNLIENAGIENVASTAWKKTNCQDSDTYGNTSEYGRNLSIYGDGATDKYYYQKIYINRPAKDLHFNLSGYAYASSVPLSDDRSFSLDISTRLSNDSTQTTYVEFNPDCTNTWQYTSDVLGYPNASDDIIVDFICVVCRYKNNANDASFDRIQLNIDETGVAYTYDEDGNLISAKDNAGRNETYDFSNAHELTKLTSSDNKIYEFTYDSENGNSHQLVKAKSNSSGIEYNFEYDDFGNVTQTRLDSSSTSMNKYIKTLNAYDSTGNYLYYTSNDRGYKTYYQYDSNKGTLQSVKDSNGNYTYYTYDNNNDRLLTASDHSSPTSSGASTVTYGYDNRGQLSTVISPSTTYSFGYDNWGNNTTVSIGNRTLVTNTYGPNNGLLTNSTYGNGLSVDLVYDLFDRVVEKTYNGSTRFTIDYNAKGAVASYTDHLINKTFYYTYDDIGRLIRTDVSDGTYFITNYNNVDLTTGISYKYANTEQNIEFEYSTKDNWPLSVKFGDNLGNKVQNGYDLLGRQTSSKCYITGSGNLALNAAYSYMNWTSAGNEDRTTNVIRSIAYTYASSAGLNLTGLRYVYDSNGNITEEHAGTALSDPLKEKYTYDSKNQLVRHDSASQDKSFVYTYDAAGNITEKKEYAYTTGTLGAAKKSINYTYGDSSWGDLLTAYNGNSIAYDNIGNPTTYNGKSLSWEGRSLVALIDGNNQYQYTYNDAGIRTSKTTNGRTTEYLLNGTQILAQKTEDDVIWFFYDSTGTRVALQHGNLTAYYVYNMQGDVIGLVDASNGKVIATYKYDAWGKCVEVNNATGYNIGTINPFRYRGYYYDEETGFYYLQSRYYNPEVGRFLNADIFASTGQGVLGCNMFSYCNNNPVVAQDLSGTISIKSAINKLAGWFSKIFRDITSAKYVVYESRNTAGHYSTGTVVSASNGTTDGTYLYKKNTVTTGNTKNQGKSTNYGIASYSNGNGASIEFGKAECSMSLTSNDTSFTLTQNLDGLSVEVLTLAEEENVFFEIGISPAAELVAAAAIVIVVVFPEAAPEVVCAAAQFVQTIASNA